MRDQALLRRFYATTWAIEAPMLAVIRGVLHRHADGELLSAEEIGEIVAAAPKRSSVQPAAGKIAVLPLWGILSPHQVNDISSGPTMGLDTWGQMFDELVADDSVSDIVLNVDSPGGSVDLVREVAAKVRAANARKNVVAVANTRAASAAYWIAAQAGTLIVSPSGAVGSIGVYAAHEDISRKLDADGVDVTLVSAGAHKVDGNPFEPLSDEARATMQANIDAYYGMFVEDVAEGRRLSANVVEQKFGQGKMVLASDAVNARMADGVATLEDVLARLQAGKTALGGRRARADEMTPQVGATSSTSSTNSQISVTFSHTLPIDLTTSGQNEADDGDRREIVRAARSRLIPSLDSGRAAAGTNGVSSGAATDRRS